MDHFHKGKIRPLKKSFIEFQPGCRIFMSRLSISSQIQEYSGRSLSILKISTVQQLQHEDQTWSIPYYRAPVQITTQMKCFLHLITDTLKNKTFFLKCVTHIEPKLFLIQ